MKDNHYNVIVVGLGAMGSAVVYQLAKAGIKVMGIDQYNPPHVHGSTHGDTRITRLAIGEGAQYIPLVRRSHELWREIEQESGESLLIQCGGLVMGIHNGKGRHGASDFLNETISLAKKYKINHEELGASQMRTGYPQFNLAGNEDGYFEAEAGYLIPEKCVEAQLKLARVYGAAIHTDEKVLSCDSRNGLAVIRTGQGTYTAEKAIISAGPWVRDFIAGYENAFKIYRQTLYWFDIKNKSEHALYADMPVFIWEFGVGADDFIYGFPAVDGPDGGVKIATEDYAKTITPEQQYDVTQKEIDNMYEKYISSNLPGLSPKCVRAASCLYTVTADHGFVIDYHPEFDNVILASPCSGHGFKHSAAIGEVLSQLAITGKSDIDISAFGLNRLC